MTILLLLSILLFSGCVSQPYPSGPIIFDEGTSNPIPVGIEEKLQVNISTMDDVRELLGEPSMKMTTNTKEGILIFWMDRDTSIYFGSSDMLSLSFTKDGRMQSATRFSVQ